MSLLDQREGTNQLKVLSSISRLEEEETTKQKDIVETTVLTKGAVSNNCKKLVEDGIVYKDGENYLLNEDRLLEYYRIHFEDYLRRRDLPSKFDFYNDVRTSTKKEMDEIIEGDTGDFLKNLLREVLSSAEDEGQIKTLRDLFSRVDCLVRSVAEDVYLSDESVSFEEGLIRLAVVMDRSPEHLSALEDYSIDLESTLTFKMANELMEVRDDA